MALDPELEKAVRYTEPEEQSEDTSAGPVICSMSETTRQKILKLMREQAEKEPR
jgi:hypothetical protein